MPHQNEIHQEPSHLARIFQPRVDRDEVEVELGCLVERVALFEVFGLGPFDQLPKSIRNFLRSDDFVKIEPMQGIFLAVLLVDRIVIDREGLVESLDKLHRDARALLGRVEFDDVDGLVLSTDVVIHGNEAAVADDSFVDCSFQLVVREHDAVESVVVVEPRDEEFFLEVPDEIFVCT